MFRSSPADVIKCCLSRCLQQRLFELREARLGLHEGGRHGGGGVARTPPPQPRPRSAPAPELVPRPRSRPRPRYHLLAALLVTAGEAMSSLLQPRRVRRDPGEQLVRLVRCADPEVLLLPVLTAHQRQAGQQDRLEKKKKYFNSFKKYLYQHETDYDCQVDTRGQSAARCSVTV